MKTKQKNILSLWALFLLGLAFVLFVLIVRQVQSQDDGPLAPATDVSTIIPVERTATPIIDTPPVFPAPITLEVTASPTLNGTQINTIYPTDVWKPYSTVIDLSPDLQESEEYFVFVQIETGEVIIYTIGPVESGLTDPLPQSIIERIPLGPNDILRSGVPPFPYRRTLNELLGQTPNPQPTVTPTLNPYP